MQQGGYALIAAIAVLALMTGIVYASDEMHKGLYAVGPIAAAVTFLWLRKLGVAGEQVSVLREYVLRAPAPAGTLEALVDRLITRGYDIDVQTKSATADRTLFNSVLLVRDKRQPPQSGHIELMIRHRDDGTAFGYLNVQDGGVGFYGELAEFVILELAGVCPRLRYATPGKEGAGADLARELPEQPYGLATL